MALWNPPVGTQDPNDCVMRVLVHFARDGRLRAPRRC